nr:hypothetical protein [Kutzneria sp. CA-103260]
MSAVVDANSQGNYKPQKPHWPGAQVTQSAQSTLPGGLFSAALLSAVNDSTVSPRSASWKTSMGSSPSSY